jgi:hypothetical protein
MNPGQAWLHGSIAVTKKENKADQPLFIRE